MQCLSFSCFVANRCSVANRQTLVRLCARYDTFSIFENSALRPKIGPNDFIVQLDVITATGLFFRSGFWKGTFSLYFVSENKKSVRNNLTKSDCTRIEIRWKRKYLIAVAIQIPCTSVFVYFRRQKKNNLIIKFI